MVINEVKTNNDQIFKDKSQALKEKEEIKTWSQQLEATIAQAYSELPELKILEATSMENIQKLTCVVKESKDVIAKFQFELQLQIPQLELKLQPMTPPKVREKRRATIKEGTETLEDAVKGCTEMFEQAMELWTSLQEDPNLQNIEEDIMENQRHFDEIRLTARKLAPVQRFAQLQEGKLIQNEIDELCSKKEIISSWTQPWIDEASELTLLVQSKLKGMQQTQRTMGFVVEGPTTEKLVEEVQKAATQAKIDLHVLNLELHELQANIEAPTE